MTDVNTRAPTFNRWARTGLVALSAASAMVAAAAQGQWQQGFGQGNLEYHIESSGMRLYIGCPTQEGSADEPSGVSLTSASSSVEVKKFSIKVGGRVYEGPFTADSRVGEDNFIALLQDLRKTDAVVAYAGKTITFPKSNAAAVLPTFPSKSFHCNLG